MRYRRITLPCFRTCSTCLSRSQAPLCQCTHRTVANRAEGTFGSLRYSFGGDHPSQTTHQALSPVLRIRRRTCEGWYFNGGSPTTSVAGSLCPSFLPARDVSLPVKRPYAIALVARLPTVLREPLEASVTLLEATTPVKLPAKRCPRTPRVRSQTDGGWYFKDGSSGTGVPVSQPPTYPTHRPPNPSAKL